MYKFLENKIKYTIENYRVAKLKLRRDGDTLNHFASLIFAQYEEEIQESQIKEIRKCIKSKTSRMSIFRGDVLYIISILISSTCNINKEKLIEDMIEIEDILVEEGFKPGEDLALTSYVIAKYGENKTKEEIVLKTKEAYYTLKEKYRNITQEDDYLVCALWALNDIDSELICNFIENVFEHVASSNIRSKNCVQGLANAIILNGSSGNMYRSLEFIYQLEKRDIKLADQFLPLIGMLYNINPRKNVDLVEGVIKNLSENESEYEYYIDKGFRTIIAVFIVSFCSTDDRRYMDELLAHGILAFNNSKNKDIFAAALN